MGVLPLTILALAAAAVGLAIARAWVLLRAVDSPDLTLREDAATTAHGELAERKQMLLQLMDSTQLDYETDKISEEDRDRTLRALKREAVVVMKQMQELGGSEQDIERAERELDAHVSDLVDRAALPTLEAHA